MAGHIHYGLFALLLFGQLCCSLAAAGGNTSCRPWTNWNNATRMCECLGDLDWIVRCDQTANETWLLYWYCMTYDEESGDTVIGMCPIPMDTLRGAYQLLPPRVSDLNRHECGRLNREGQLCGRCKPHYGTGMLSYGYHCHECSGMYHGWVLYLTLELVPVTIFFLLVLIFQIQVVSPSMNAFVLVSQMIAAVNMHKPPIGSYPLGNHSVIWVKVIMVACGIWNLEFLRQFVSPFCISASLTGMQVIALQYVSVVYLLVLTALVWICIELHVRNFWLLVLIWRPFHLCFTRLRRVWSPQASIINAFATFLVVSYSRMLLTSSNLLYPVQVYRNHEGVVSTSSNYYMYYEGNLKFFSTTHLPLAAIAIVAFVVFNLLPLFFLTLYPLRCVQHYLNTYCPRLQGARIKAISDAFMGWYRDRYRCFGGLYLGLRVALFLSHFHIDLKWLSWLLPALVFLLASLIFTILRPYKDNRFNVLDGLIYALFSIMCGLQTIVSLQLGDRASRPLVVIAHTLALIPAAYLLLYTCTKQGKLLLQRYCRSQLKVTHSSDSDSDTLPDRLLQPRRYKPLTSSFTSGTLSNGNREEEEGALLVERPPQGYGSVI